MIKFCVSFINFIPPRWWKYTIAILRCCYTCVLQLWLSWPPYKLIVHVRGAKRTIQFNGFVKAISRIVFAFAYLINSTWEKKTCFYHPLEEKYYDMIPLQNCSEDWMMTEISSEKIWRRFLISDAVFIPRFNYVFY